jgi:hypothetical protein
VTSHERVTFDDLLDRMQESSDCPVCYGGVGEPCEEECSLILERAARRSVVRELYLTARRAVIYARAYTVLSDGEPDFRVVACLEAVRTAREEIKRLRDENRGVRKEVAA